MKLKNLEFEQWLEFFRFELEINLSFPKSNSDIGIATTIKAEEKHLKKATEFRNFCEVGKKISHILLSDL